MDLNNVFIADCETNGFLPMVDRIHTFGISWKSPQGEWLIKDTANHSDMIKVLSNPKNFIVMHNGILYDKPVLEKILGITISATIIDTLPLAWVLFPNRIKEGKKYGLESFGVDYGVAKPIVQDDEWIGLTKEEEEDLQYLERDYPAIPAGNYLEYEYLKNKKDAHKALMSKRVKEDVLINRLLWEDILSYYMELYDGETQIICSHIRFLCSIMDLVAEQEKYGLKLDVDTCQSGLDILQKLAEDKVEILKTIMPRIPKKKIKNYPSKGLYKQDGSLSVAGVKWVELLANCKLDPSYKGPIEVIDSYEEPNPNSVDQVKNYLFSLGWVPEIFSDTINTKGEAKKVAQIKTKEKLLCPSILKLTEIEPKIKELDDLSVINHRASYLKGFLKNVREDLTIPAQINGFTNTVRLKHKTLVNLPKVSAPFGKYVRPVLTCEDDEVLIGSDLSSLENYTRTNFVLPWQPDAGDILADPDYDSHTQLAIYAGMMDQADEDLFKWTKKGSGDKSLLPEKYSSLSDEDLYMRFNELNLIRNKAKTTSYSALYGVGKVKLAIELKIPESEAVQLLEGYWKLNAAVKLFAESCTVKTVRNQMWVLNPGNGFWYSLRSRKDIFSVVNQGFGSFIHVLWCRNTRKRGLVIRANFHDEQVLVCKKSDIERYKEGLQGAIEETNAQLKLKVPVKIDVQIGKNYGEVH